MSAFLLVHDDVSPQRVARLDTSYQAAGFAKVQEKRLGPWRFLAFGALSEAPTAFYETQVGDWIFVVGCFVYRGMIGDAALASFFEDQTNGTLSVDKVTGHYITVTKRGETIEIASDPLNALKIYHDAKRTVYSSQYTHVLELLDAVTADPQGVYEYAWFGVVNGVTTMVREIKSVASHMHVVIEASGRSYVLADNRPRWRLPDFSESSFEEAIDYFEDALAGQLKAFIDHFGDRLKTALSGGYDSRLIVALLLAGGVTPRLFVYGNEQDTDRAVALDVGKRLGIAVDAIDKTQFTPDPDVDPKAQFTRSYYAFDGWKNQGIFDSGVDFSDRVNRMKGNAVFINGSAGESLRNFFYLPDGRYSIDHVISAFYSTYDPEMCSSAFDETLFRRALRDQIALDLNVDPKAPISRDMVELVYPLFRVRYWSARDLQLNQSFGWALYPFMLPQTIYGTATLPLSWKTHGRLEAALITRIHPEIAAVKSDYGFAFTEPPPLTYRMKMALTYGRPAWLRKRTYRLKMRGRRHREVQFPAFLKKEALGQHIDITFPAMTEFFQIDRITDPDVYNRVATMEYLLARSREVTM
ncbi:MAG: hypothetical protein AAGF15_08770 [Pseudomonadota bacterium]